MRLSKKREEWSGPWVGESLGPWVGKSNRDIYAVMYVCQNHHDDETGWIPSPQNVVIEQSKSFLNEKIIYIDVGKRNGSDVVEFLAVKKVYVAFRKNYKSSRKVIWSWTFGYTFFT